jgi:hypothetical protein
LSLRSRAARRGAATSLIVLAFAACADHASQAPTEPNSAAPAIEASLSGIALLGSPASIVTAMSATQCIDASLGGAGTPGAMQLWTCNGSTAQTLTWKSDGSIRAFGGTMCLDDAGARGTDGDSIIVWPCNGQVNQRWSASSVGEIKGINGKCIDARHGTSTNGTRLILWPCNGQVNQRWDVRAGSSTPSAIVRVSSGSGQVATYGTAVAQPLVVTVTDASGKPLAGKTVNWASTDGVVSPAASTTDAYGHASTRLTISRTFFTTTATATVGTSIATFTASGNGTPNMQGRRPFPSTNPWNTDISAAAVDPNSATLIASCGATRVLHPDFGTVWSGAPNGIPFVVVHGTQGKVPITFRYSSQSDPGPYPIPSNAPIQGGTSSTGDRHVLIIDWDNWKAYEVFSAYPPASGSTTWTAGSGAIFDLTTGALRPAGWTSADAAGLPMFPGLVRYDEAVTAGVIAHALRMSCDQSRNAYVAPARHAAGDGTSTSLPPMGMRVRLKKSVDISGFSPTNQVILRALQRYGAFVADDGWGFMISGAPDPRWSDSDLHNLQLIKPTDFEVVKMGTVTPYP